MTELFQNAWTGWQNYTRYGKVAALFVIAVFYLLFQKKTEGPPRKFVSYGAVAGVLCVLPPTAVFLMSYQTKFYDYEWIWSFVPVTAIIALGGTVFLAALWRQKCIGFKNICYKIAVTVFLALIVVMCGGLGDRLTDLRQERQQREEAGEILQMLEERCGGRDICLWAPREILEYVRIENAGTTLLYGRNMWDISLNAYSYDAYTLGEEELYQWMEGLCETGEWVQKYEGEYGSYVIDGSDCMRRALELGAKCILLPRGFQAEIFTELKEAGWMPEQMRITELGDYYLFDMG